MNTIIRSAFLLGVICFFQGCGEEPLTEAEVENQVAEFLEVRDYPSRDQLEITLEWQEDQGAWHAEIVPKQEYRAELSGDWNWPVQMLVTPEGVIGSVY